MVTFKGASTTNITGYSVTGDVVANNNNFSLQNITIDGTVDSNGGDITISNATTTSTVTATRTSNGSSGGDINILNAVVGALISNGSVNGTGNGGHAGNITIATSTTGAIFANGANGTANGGNGGVVNITNSIGIDTTSTTITANGGNSTSCGNGGDSGEVTLTNSTYGTITTEPGNAAVSGCPSSSKSQGQRRTPVVTGEHQSVTDARSAAARAAAASTPTRSTGGILRNLTPFGRTNFTPLPTVNFFNPNGGVFNPTNIGVTVVPFPFQNFKPVTPLVLTPSPQFDVGVSKFLFAPLPQTITAALKDAPKLANFIAAAGVNTEQSLAILASKPLALQDTTDGELTPGHFIARQGIQPITTYATYDISLGGIAEMIKVSTNQQISISLVPLSTGEVTATYLNQTLNFTQGKSFYTTTITTPFEPGRYVLKTSSSPIPLIIEVTNPAPITPKPQEVQKSWNPFNFVWKLFGK